MRLQKMQISKTPASIEKLDLMIMLKEKFSDDEDCQILHSNIISFVNKMLIPLLSKINAREMESFTMHDSKHSLKVAHLMFHIIHEDRRNNLTPPEIALLVISAFLHDLGMALSPQQREDRLDPESDLWYHLEVDQDLNDSINQLKEIISNDKIPEAQRDRARYKLYQAEEALLCRDTRQNHATQQRYEELLNQLQQFHNEDPSSLPDVESCLSFSGDSFRDKLIEICVSHGKDFEFLLDNDDANIERHRFPKDYTLGSYNADLHMVAAALRLADILDFDRERTPSVLFYYLLPTNLTPQDDKSVMEWSKHLTISNWFIDEDAVVYRGHCKSHIIHHTIVQFCSDIEREIKSTSDTFAIRKTDFPFNLPKSVQSKIEQQGYIYVPYKFELDDNRVYQLLMGGAIYENPLVAVRELVQNAVDACKLRDALMQMHEPHYSCNTTERITIRYEEPTEQCKEPKLIVTDTGTGMDKWLLENYFLKVGVSYYNSPDFNKFRLQLRAKSLDFAPISEFGIGFLSCFLISDRLQIETAMWESVRSDTIKRKLVIDGPTRLIRLSEDKNEGLNRFKGTSVMLYLSRGNRYYKNKAPYWGQIRDYLKDICQDLPYRLNLEYISNDGKEVHESIDRIPLVVELPEDLDKIAVRIPVNEQESGLEGEIVIINPYEAQKLEKILSEDSPIRIENEESQTESSLLRGGFKIGPVPGLPRIIASAFNPRAKLRFNWNYSSHKRYPLPNLARNSISDYETLSNHITRLLLNYLLFNSDTLPEGLLDDLETKDVSHQTCMEQYNALKIYKLARQGWRFATRDISDDKLEAWENGFGESLRLGIFRESIHWQLLDIILPKITTLQMGKECRFYVKPPMEGWRKILEGWYDYIKSPIQWGYFVEYIGDIANLLLYEYPGTKQFNSLYKERLLQTFNKEELPHFLYALLKITGARGNKRQAILDNYEITLFKKAQQHLGEIEIGETNGSWRIDSFKI